MPKLIICFAVLGLLCACGGGGGGSSGSNSSPPLTRVTTELTVLDASPDAAVSMLDIQRAAVRLAHLGYTDASLTSQGDCVGLGSARRSVRDLSDPDFDSLDEHLFSCSEVVDNSTVQLQMSADRGANETVLVQHTFGTAIRTMDNLVRQDTINLSPASLQIVFQDYLSGLLFNELGLPFDERLQVISGGLALIENWANLSDPQPEFAVVANRVSYAAADPLGNVSSATTGLVVRPQMGATPPTPRPIILLAHATGSTPGDLDPANAWYLLANLLASYGYLVIAPDNWGRGGTNDQDETYLMGHRTAENNLNLVNAVVSSADYEDLVPVADPLPLILIGYSQGGHTAAAILHQLLTGQSDRYVLEGFYAGGGPYNLYATFAGVMQHLAGQCAGDAYCSTVDEAVTVPFATNRILPGLLRYTNTDLDLDDVVQGDMIAQSFVEGFTNNAASLDRLKAMLQLNSFTNLTNAQMIYASGLPTLNLYHAPLDRLVPFQNQLDWQAVLTGADVIEHTDICDGADWQNITLLTNTVGVIHSLCGIAMMDHVVGQLR